MKADWRDRIRVDPEICHGKPCIRGTRGLASVILLNFVVGRTADEIIGSYPGLRREDIQAALSYSAELVREGSVHLDKTE